jgi:hypothetical protein
MLTREPKYTLIVAHLQFGDLELHQEPTEMGRKLSQITTDCVTIGRGMYLFDTQRDYVNIHRLLTLLRSHNRTAAKLPVESELHLVCHPTIAERISEAFPDLKLYILPTEQTQ